MATPAALFSRLQLAAALLEYDNDPDNPDAPKRSAQDSAIFAHLRRNPAARPEVATRRSDYLGASETGSLGGRESALDTRRSRLSKGSIDALRNPFPADTTSDGLENEEGEEGLEVDLASWGLDAFIPKDKKSAKAKGKQPAPAVGSTRAHLPSTNNHDPSWTSPRHGLITSKSISLGGDIEAHELMAPDEGQRRRSFGSPLDLVGMESSGLPFHTRRRAGSQASLTHSQPLMVPFPRDSTRSPSPGVDQAYGETLPRVHNRTHSNNTLNSRYILEDAHRNSNEYRQHELASDAMGLAKPPEDNPFAIEAPSHISRFDPKNAPRARSYSNATMGSRLMPENDAFSVVTEDPYARERRYSTLELLRPKVLVMPSPLQPVSKREPLMPTRKVQEGFELSTDGPPLPPGARAARRLSSTSIMEPGNALVASNSFTPTPYTDLTLSQKTFRSTLAVPGQAASYSDLNTAILPRAMEDGEQAIFDPVVKDPGIPIVPVMDPDVKTGRPAGKLYGKSLIDDLETRKAQMRSKQRVFTGDQRPSMMARNSATRVSTLIDPESLKAKPGLPDTFGVTPGSNLARHPSLTMKPLITFDGDGDKAALSPPNANRIPTTRSVFGVDTLWEREMAKLKEMQASEEAQNAARRKQEEEEERRREEKKNRKKKKGKDKGKNAEEMQELSPPQLEPPASPRVSAEPPVLPVIPRAPRRAPPKPSDSDMSSLSDEDDGAPPTSLHKEASVVWHSSEDEDAGPRRTTGVGPRYPNHNRKASRPPDDDSEEDIPLVAAMQKARAKMSRYDQGSEDEDKPLSHILLKAKSGNSRNPADEDDDEPLGLRASRLPMANADEDDTPLAFHPEHQRRTQYQMLAHHQQQQQMMMQAQMQSNMFMNASMMGSGFFAPPMMNPMMMQMGPIPSPPPMHDEAKYGLVDRWRRDVVVDRENV